VPTVVTQAGRRLQADGGVVPDLLVADDTLTLAEQRLVVESARAGIPLTLRVAEFTFEEARRAQGGGGPPEFDASTLDAFLARLKAEGLPAEVADDPQGREYLAWRSRMAFEDRVGHTGHSLEVQAERDRVLAAALRLLAESDSQSALFGAVRSQVTRAARGGPTGG
jgi:hypothetical protein